MIKNIVFDMGMVIFEWVPKKLIAKYHLGEEDEKFLLNKVFGSYKWQLLDYGYFKDEGEFLYDILKEVPQRLQEVVKELVFNWEGDGIVQIPGMEELIKNLKSKGYGIYLLSNAGPRQPEYWKTLEVSRYFDGTIVSALVKQYKPCPDIYKTLLERFNLKAEECVFIDDMPQNCAGAFCVGFNTVVFRGCEDLKENLKNLGVAI